MNELAVGLSKASAEYDQSPFLEGSQLRKLFSSSSLHLSGSKQAVHAVEDTSLSLYPGRATALVGESGSGKTTVARILAGLYSPTSGTVRFRGEPAKLTDKSYLQTYRHTVQLILQDPFASLNPVHDVRYHLARPLRIFNQVQSRNQETEQILSLLHRVNLSPAEQFMQKFPHQLSCLGITCHNAAHMCESGTGTASLSNTCRGKGWRGVRRRSKRPLAGFCNIQLICSCIW